MRLNKISLACLTLCGSALMVACGGGSGSAPPATTQQIQAPTMQGAIVNSYIAKAVVTLDFNDNGVCEATEPQVVSGVKGEYAFPGLGDHAVCSSGGINIGTGFAFVGELKGPKGGGAITPLTTLVVAQLGNNPNPTPAQITAAKSLIETQLNLPAGSISVDPVAAISNPAIGARLEQTNAAVQIMLRSITNSVIALAGVDSVGITPAMQSQVFADAAKAMVSTLTAPGAPKVDLTSAASSNGTDIFVRASVSQTIVNAQAAPTSALRTAAPAGALASLSPVNAAAFVTSNISVLVQNTAQAIPTAAGIAAAQAASQSSTTLVNAIQTVVASAPALFSTLNTATPAQVAALSAILSPSASAVASRPVIVTNIAALSDALDAATSDNLTVDLTKATKALVEAVASPPPPPQVQTVTNFATPVVAPLPAPIVNTVTITGST